MAQRWLLLPSRGHLLVSTDLHGNLEDLERLVARFRETLERDSETHWAILGDAVHGPSEEWRRRKPAFYGFPDESGAVVRRILELKQQHPSRVHYVLGNHDYGHIGGPHTSKFYDDEVAHLEAVLDGEGQANLRELFAPALLAVVAPCGALLTHGAPGEVLSSFRKLDDLPLPANVWISAPPTRSPAL